MPTMRPLFCCRVMCMHAQLLPGYSAAFREFPWVVRESEHHVFHYAGGSLAAREIEHIIEIQERAFQKITRFLDITPPERPISYFLYSDEDTKEKLMGSRWFAQSVYEEFAVHALYTEEHRVIGPHEDTHLLSLPFGLSIGFLQEGLAEWMVGHSWSGESFKETVRTVLQDGNFPVSADLLIRHEAWLETDDSHARQYYALAALFADFLIRAYGKERYLKLYASLDRSFSGEENGSQYVAILDCDSRTLFDRYVAEIR